MSTLAFEGVRSRKPRDTDSGLLGGMAPRFELLFPRGTAFVAAFAAWIPARRAAGLNPHVAPRDGN